MTDQSFEIDPVGPHGSRAVRVLEGKTAIVTGAGAGIGRGIARLFANEGANVIVADRSSDDGEATVRAITSEGGQATFLQGDVTDPNYHSALVDLACSSFGQLDIAVNNAGISLPPTPLVEVPLDTWARIIEVNLTGAFYAVRAQIPAMIETGGGAIVNMASAAGLRAVRGTSPYVASKHGLIGLTKNIAAEYAEQGIRANAIAPGFIDTQLSNTFPPEQRANLASVAPMNRLGRITEVAELALFLANDRSSFITGDCIAVDGGTLAQ